MSTEHGTEHSDGHGTQHGSEHHVAIIGVAGRFPGAGDAEQYWANLRDGVESIAFPTDDELWAAGVPRDLLNQTGYVKAVASAPDVENFDAAFFGYTPREAAHSDPQIRMFLEVAHSALENAGFNPYAIDGDVGVYATSGTNRYIDLHLRYMGDVSATSSFMLSSLNNIDYVASTVAYKFSLRGPAITLSTACSSSLVAVHLAAQALRNGECDVALAGGVDVEFPVAHGYLWEEGGPVSRDGHVRPFDVKANGTLFGTGCGAVVLKRLDDALADGDTILAVIRGSAVNNDGSDKAGFSAPSLNGQAAAVAQALGMAGVSPADVSYVEAHATGTPLGDPIEVAALDRAFRAVSGSLAGGADLAPGSCALSSVKGNVGHLGHAAGIASLIKAAYALRHGEIPATANFTEPNPKLRIQETPFYVADRLVPWPRKPDRPRFAGVSSFGVGGTNCHVVLAEGPSAAPAQQEERPRIVVWSAKAEAAELAYRDRLAAHLREKDEENFPAVVSTLQEGRRAYPIRRAIVAGSAAEAVSALTGSGAGFGAGSGAGSRAVSEVGPGVASGAGSGAASGAGSGVVSRVVSRLVSGVVEGAAERRDVVFAFPGQGAQQVAMALGLHGSDDAFTRAFDDVLGLFAGHGLELADPWREADAAQLAEATLAQPLLFAVEYALARSLMAKGVHPSALVGHSVGELAAAAVAEVFTLEDAVALVTARARAMALAPPGAMIAVAAPAEEVSAAVPSGLTVAVVNGPRQTVLAGTPEDVDAAVPLLTERKIACTGLATSGAFHTPLMAGAAALFAEAFDEVRLSPPRLPLYSAAAGRRVTDEEATDPSFWADQVAAPVRFDRALDALFGDGRRLLVETGPGQILTTLARRHPAVKDGASAAVPLLPREAGDPAADARQTLTAVARIWAEGHDVLWAEVRQGEPLRRVPLPGQVYQRRRHWVDASYQRPGETETASATVPSPAPADSLTGVADPAPARVWEGRETGEAGETPDTETADTEETPFSTLSWVESHDREPFVPVEGTCLALLPADPGESLRYVLALQQAGLRPVIVRPGTAYAEVAGEFRVRPDSRDDLARVLSALAARGAAPRLLVHAVAVAEGEPVTAATADARLNEVFMSLLALVQAGTRGAGRPPGLLVLVSRSLDVTGAEPIDPVHAALHGFVRSLVKEASQLGCRLVDVGPGTDEHELAAEIALWERHDVVALRGPRRWVRAEVPFTAGVAVPSPIRRSGVYLITGGLGGLGLAVARELAGTGLRLRLVLLGRTGIPEGDGDRAARLRAQVSELESLGAEVRAISCDVTDRRALRRVLDSVTARYGPVNGVLHLAGIAGDGLAQLRGQEDARAVLAPKAHGTLHLTEAFADRPALDFFVCFSSRAATDGLVGSADYAAANAFQDACAQVLRRSGVAALSINWPSWARVGMAAEHGVRTWSAELSVENCPLLDEHRVDGVAVLPGTGHIDMVLRAHRSISGHDGPVRLKDILFHQVMAAREARRVEIRLYPDGRFESWSRPAADASAEPVKHASGTVAAGRPAAGQVDLDALRRRLSHYLDEDEDDIPRLFSLGPRWHNNPHTWTLPGGDTSEMLLHLELEGELAAEVAAHVVHPTLLDSATGSVRRPEDGLYLPFLYNELVVHDTLPAQLFAHIRRLPGAGGVISADVDLIAPDGRLLGRAVGYTMRKVDGRSFLREPDTTSGPSQAPASGEDGIEPEEGARLLMTLLRARHPGQVVVEPGARPVRRAAAGPGRGKAPREAAIPVPAVPTPPAPLATASPPAVAGLPATPAPVSAAPASSVSGVPASPGGGADPGSVEARLVSVWAEALGEPEIALDADFFELGGNSLSAVELMTRIRSVFAVDLSIAALFDYPTINSLAGVLREQGAR
ncbi:SDR family NAD(P)-dependent oxidoreductase [Planotetraspora sp. A-T 1434]|uniref:type I polyketide synthase n=1 Tax=Planotetraspora sp. A-T 1434 TaxID=2979219 RepID=UPI0021BF5BEB|nr:type I polyketide synthase [Planotetraspora sp. A-T 1434]MCT9932201.1 SDR family NAD(P)-dependent oxidoreductase [Planotetraspora sp. A-T 1434]